MNEIIDQSNLLEPKDNNDSIFIFNAILSEDSVRVHSKGETTTIIYNPVSIMYHILPHTFHFKVTLSFQLFLNKNSSFDAVFKNPINQTITVIDLKSFLFSNMTNDVKQDQLNTEGTLAFGIREGLKLEMEGMYSIELIFNHQTEYVLQFYVHNSTGDQLETSFEVGG